MILSDLAKYAMTRSTARPLCDSRATCSIRILQQLGPILYHFGDKAINWWKIAILGRRYYGTLRSPYVVAIPSVCCRLSVTFVTSQPTHKVQLFGSISAPANSLDTRAVCVKISDINSTGLRQHSS